MGKFLLVVHSSGKPGRKDEYNDWYDSIHLDEVLAIPGVVSGKRYDALEVSPNPVPADHVAIFELEIEDPTEVLKAIGRQARSGEMRMTDSIDSEFSKMWLYKAH